MNVRYSNLQTLEIILTAINILLIFVNYRCIFEFFLVKNFDPSSNPL